MKHVVSGLGLVTVAAAYIASAGFAAAGWDKSRETAADATLNGLLGSTTASVAACIAMDGVPVYQKAFGMASPGVPATPTTIYRIGSLSKQFTAAAILALIEDGGKVPKDGSKFSLDDNVSLFFDGVSSWSTPGSPMTVKRLANMTSNLPNYTKVTLPPALVAAQPVKEGALLNAILGFQPTSSAVVYTYSNTNYFLLAKIIDQVAPTLPRRWRGGPLLIAKPDYRAYIRNRLFARAGLTATNFIDDPNPLGTEASPQPGVGTAFANMSWPKGAGAVRSNVVDLCKWDAALVGGKILTPASAAIMGTAGSPMTGSPPNSYAMGWGVATFPAALEYSHNGWIAGFSAVSDLVYYDNGKHNVAVVILSNGDFINYLPQARIIAQSAMNPP